jgi:hypothetical protein
MRHGGGLSNIPHISVKGLIWACAAVSNPELARIGRARSRCHFRRKQAEIIVEGYAFRLALIEARIQELAPELNLAAALLQARPALCPQRAAQACHRVLREANGRLPSALWRQRASAISRPADVQGDADAPGAVPEQAGRAWDHPKGWEGEGGAAPIDELLRRMITRRLELCHSVRLSPI